MIEQSSPVISFSKQRRFIPKKIDPPTDAMYNLPSTKIKRSTSLGLGDKYDSTSHLPTIIGPDHYEKLSKIGSPKNQHIYTMGLPKASYQKVNGSARCTCPMIEHLIK